MIKQQDEEGGTQLQRALQRKAQLRLNLKESKELRLKDHNEWLSLFANEGEEE
jgi:hypothetical protein